MYDIKKTFNAKTLDEALRLLSENPEARLLAGGTDILVALRHHKISDAVIINIREIPELKGIELLENGDLRIGPCTEFDTIYKSELALQTVPMLCHASNSVGSPQIRHIGTVGGNLCNGAVSADTAPSFLTYDAMLTVKSVRGTRTFPATELHTGPGRTQLEPDEILTDIIIRRKDYEGWGGSYLKFGQRNAMEISTLGVACTVKLTEDKKHILAMRMTYGVAAPVPTRVRKMEEYFAGKRIDEELYDYFNAHILEELNPRDSWRASRAFREQLIKVQGIRAFKNAVRLAGGEADV